MRSLGDLPSVLPLCPFTNVTQVVLTIRDSFGIGLSKTIAVPYKLCLVCFSQQQRSVRRVIIVGCCASSCAVATCPKELQLQCKGVEEVLELKSTVQATPTWTGLRCTLAVPVFVTNVWSPETQPCKSLSVHLWVHRCKRCVPFRSI